MSTATSYYNAQLEAKRDIVIQALERHSRLNIEAIHIRPTIGMEDPCIIAIKANFKSE